VNVSPIGSGSVEVNGDVPASYPYIRIFTSNTYVTFKAVPASGYAFDRWSGDLSGTANPAILLVDCNKSITANFQKVNEPPVANAGDDQTVNESDTVTLDGSASYDPDGQIVSYLWTQTGGTDVTLSDPTDPQPTFVTPPVDAGGAELTFELMVMDGDGGQSTDEVLITVIDNNIAGFPSDVITFNTSTGKNMGVKAGSGGHITSLWAISPDTIDDPEGQPDNLIYGLIDMVITVDTEGGTAEVTLYLPEAAPDNYTCYKYLPGSGGWIDFSANAVFNAERDRVVLTLTDGGDGDDDGAANRIIIDPTGLGTDPNAPSPPIDDGGGTDPDPPSTPIYEGGDTDGGGGCFVSTVQP
jgi:hypothetical protein